MHYTSPSRIPSYEIPQGKPIGESCRTTLGIDPHFVRLNPYRWALTIRHNAEPDCHHNQDKVGVAIFTLMFLCSIRLKVTRTGTTDKKKGTVHASTVPSSTLFCFVSRSCFYCSIMPQFNWRLVVCQCVIQTEASKDKAHSEHEPKHDADDDAHNEGTDPPSRLMPQQNPFHRPSPLAIVPNTYTRLRQIQGKDNGILLRSKFSQWILELVLHFFL